MKNKSLRRAEYAFGIFMAFLMAFSLFAPSVRNSSRNSSQLTATPRPTATPLPTVPPPLTDFTGITFDTDYLHPSGLYSVRYPTGWTPEQPSNDGTQVRITFSNPTTLSEIEVYLKKPTSPVTTVEELDQHFTEAIARGSWGQYRNATESVRNLEGDRLSIDFTMTDYQERPLIGRHVAWIEGDWIYVVRVSTPQNAPQLLLFLIDAMTNQITLYPQLAAAPVLWEGFYDSINRHILRHPPLWERTDGGENLPTSFEDTGTGGVQLRVEAQANVIADEAAARDWVQALGSAVTVVSAVPVTRMGGEGFSVAYNSQNPDGEPLSGLAILLNGVDGQLHIARIQYPVGGLDLNSETARAADELANRVGMAMDTFSLLTDLVLPAPTLEATAIPAQ